MMDCKLFNNTFSTAEIIWPCYMGPYHHGIIHFHVVDGGDGLQIWRVAASSSNEQ